MNEYNFKPYIYKSIRGSRYLGFHLHKHFLAITKSFSELLTSEYVDIEYDLENKAVKFILNGTTYRLAKDKLTATHINCSLGQTLPEDKYFLKDRENLICTLI